MHGRPKVRSSHPGHEYKVDLQLRIEDVIKANLKLLITKYIPAIDIAFGKLLRNTPNDQHPLHRSNCRETISACFAVEGILATADSYLSNGLGQLYQYSCQRFANWTVPEDEMRVMFWNTTGKHVASDDIRSLFWTVYEDVTCVYDGLSFTEQIWTGKFPFTWMLIGERFGNRNREGWVFVDVSEIKSAGYWNI